jgi:type III secretory pathway component EscT
LEIYSMMRESMLSVRLLLVSKMHTQTVRFDILPALKREAFSSILRNNLILALTFNLMPLVIIKMSNNQIIDDLIKSHHR